MGLRPISRPPLRSTLYSRSKRAAIRIPVWLIQRRTVQRVIEFSSELNIEPLLPEILPHHQIQIARSGTVEVIPWCIAERTARWYRERSSVQIDGFVRGVF